MAVRPVAGAFGAGLVLQAENLTDRQAAEAMRCRIDWKGCLGLELDDPGFGHSVLSEFRSRMARGVRADQLPAVMVVRLVEARAAHAAPPRSLRTGAHSSHTPV
jgi:hypothetical protein